MKLNSNLPAFYGYYGSGIDEIDDSSELEYVNELRDANGMDPLTSAEDFEYDWEGFYNQWNHSCTNIVEDHLKGLEMVKSIEFIKLHSPRFYNFTNDRIECEIDINVGPVKEYIFENKDKFAEYLRDNFKSRDGFSSSYEYDVNFWINKLEYFEDLDHIEVCAVLDFIINNEDSDYNLFSEVYNSGESPYASITNAEELATKIEETEED